MIPCKFKLRPEFTCIPSKFKKPKLKSGKYHGSYFWNIPAFGRNTWMVLATIEADFEKALADGKSLEAVVEDCLSFLNQPIKKRRKTKKNPNPKDQFEYGFLSLYHAEAKKSDGKIVSVIVHLLTDDQRNKNFWGEGQSAPSTAIRSRKLG